jgi:hypothetical protein
LVGGEGANQKGRKKDGNENNTTTQNKQTNLNSG